MNKGMILLIGAAVISFASGIYVTYAELSKGMEIFIGFGIPLATIGVLFYFILKNKKDSDS